MRRPRSVSGIVRAFSSPPSSRCCSRSCCSCASNRCASPAFHTCVEQQRRVPSQRDAAWARQAGWQVDAPDQQRLDLGDVDQAPRHAAHHFIELRRPTAARAQRAGLRTPKRTVLGRQRLAQRGTLIAVKVELELNFKRCA
eukprot:scaffold79214_cov71-Phaeocystis_antarctica.AAC.4